MKWNRRRRRRRRTYGSGRLPAFSVHVLLKDGSVIVATAHLVGIADNGVALYEADLFGVDRGDVDHILDNPEVGPPDHSLLRVRCLPAVIDLRRPPPCAPS